MAVLLPADDAGVSAAADMIREGKLVAFPTETVYGLGTNARDAVAVAALFESKGRPRFDPVIVHVASREAVDALCGFVPPLARRLMEDLWPGPLTLVLPKSEAVPDIVTAGGEWVGVRMPDHPVALELIRRASVPVAAPSANRFGMLSPTEPSHVLQQVGERIDAVLDGGKTPVGVESTVVRVVGECLELLRPGGVPVETLRRYAPVGPPEEGGGKLLSPGMTKKHYAPSVPLILVDAADDISSPSPNAGLLAFRAVPAGGGFARVEVLSPRGSLREAAANLFSCLHRLQSSGVSVIYAEKVPEKGVGLAVMDRLRRASATVPSAGGG